MISHKTNQFLIFLEKHFQLKLPQIFILSKHGEPRSTYPARCRAFTYYGTDTIGAHQALLAGTELPAIRLRATADQAHGQGRDAISSRVVGLVTRPTLDYCLMYLALRLCPEDVHR